jgi:hypothetical protein
MAFLRLRTLRARLTTLGRISWNENACMQSGWRIRPVVALKLRLSSRSATSDPEWIRWYMLRRKWFG